MQSCGYENVLSPLLKDLHTLEQDGIFLEPVGQCIKGTVMCVAADKLAALQALCSVSDETMSAGFVSVLQTRDSPAKFLKENLA